MSKRKPIKRGKVKKKKTTWNQFFGPKNKEGMVRGGVYLDQMAQSDSFSLFWGLLNRNRNPIKLQMFNIYLHLSSIARPSRLLGFKIFYLTQPAALLFYFRFPFADSLPGSDVRPFLVCFVFEIMLQLDPIIYGQWWFLSHVLLQTAGKEMSDGSHHLWLAIEPLWVQICTPQHPGQVHLVPPCHGRFEWEGWC